MQDVFKVLEDKKHLRRKNTHTRAKDNVIEFKKPEPFVDDPITDVLSSGPASPGKNSNHERL
ncbi:MAG: hypothetical protein JRJ11_02060 [Deltaproteobacteria bacterium]|nr:hypothetical protein [Deltaproteobacteria bacterium]MBW1908313.1 hypothetical protein [Deltaproteobacteria bacterium]MBW2032606.1 hypothetical protein [Deltaproteobacteria bacterium]MBW2113578.1 hypothetical protein [Deltaproteobacteria bacterium]MBW2167701.1 hypothetical protein [Deltaproteobacteria bacterium]